MPQTVGYPADSITKAHAEEAKWLLEDLEISRQNRAHRETRWERSEKQYALEMWERDDPSSDLIHIGVSFSTANTILPHITGRDPVFMIEPVSKDATPKNARIQEAWLNRKWKHIGAQQALEDASWNYVIHGDGYMKVTYELIRRPINADDFSVIVEEHIDAIDPWDVWIDPYANGIYNARWVAVRMWLTEEEARLDESLSIPRGYSFGSDGPKHKDSRTATSAAQSEHRRWVELYELYDLVNDVLYVMPKDGEKPWKVVEEMTCPVVQIGNHRLPNSPYHMGDMEPIYDVQREIDKTRSQMITHRKRNIAKVLVREDSLTEEGKSALKSGIVGEFVPIKGTDGMPLDSLVKPIQMQPLSSDSYNVSSIAQQDVYEISGITEYQRGASPDITRTATEAQIMQGSSNVKLDAKLKSIERAVTKLGEYLLGVAREVYPLTDADEMAIFIGGIDAKSINQLQAGDEARAALEAGNEQLAGSIARTADLYGEAIVSMSEEIFVGTYQVFVEHASTDAMNPQKKADKYRRVFQMLLEASPMLAQSGVQLDIGRVLRLWLEAEGLPGLDAILSGPSQPQMAPQPGAPPQGAPPGPGPVPPGAPFPSGGAGPAPSPADIEQLVAMMSDQGFSPDNTGALDPGAYPNVGR